MPISQDKNMENNSLTKILGWALLIVGLLIIFYFLFSSYSIFTGKTPPPQVFKMEALDSSATLTPPPSKELTSQEQMEQLLEAQMEEQLSMMLPLDHLSKLLNLIAWSILTGVFIFGGAHISGLGINLIKK